jgi:hypothetical protein
MRSTSHGRSFAGPRELGVELLEGDLQLVERVAARLVHARALLVGPMSIPEKRYESAGGSANR